MASASGRVLALDPGQRRIGVAVSDSERTMAFPRPAISVEASGRHIDGVLELVDEEGAVVVVIGLPKGLDGREGASARNSRSFAQAIEQRLAGRTVAVELHDERLTTVQAAGSLRVFPSSTASLVPAAIRRRSTRTSWSRTGPGSRRARLTRLPRPCCSRRGSVVARSFLRRSSGDPCAPPAAAQGTVATDCARRDRRARGARGLVSS